MKQISLLISRYLVSTIFPYFVFAWLLLSVILFVQQASRYADIFFSVNIPANLIWQLTIALIPNVIAFTCPMAMLVGTIIGLTKMQGDSELVAIRASGVGNLQIAMPIMILGVLLSIFAFIVNLEGVPLAATLVRNVALQTAIKKLESPIEPGVFNTEVAGYTIYVKGGDFETGRWKNIFIYRDDPANGTARLITSKQGRIDTTDQLSELVLENAVVTTIPIQPGRGKYVSENLGEIRLAIQTKRSDLIKKLSGSQVSPEELGLSQLSEFAASADGRERVEAQILWQRRILLSVTPLIFCLLGTVIVLRFNRGGRGFGTVLALGVLIGFYLLAFLGEQLARTGKISVLTSSMIPIVGSIGVILWFNYSRKINFWSGWGRRVYDTLKGLWERQNKIQIRNLFVDLTTGLRDFDIVRNLLKNFLLTLIFLSATFIIFTAFELWKFAGTFDGGVLLLVKYLFYLLPFVYLQVAPSAAMIGTLATYVIKSRQNEIVIWTSAGQSVYRLLVPCFILMLLIGGLNWVVQERLLPKANQRQDTTRNLIRNRGVSETTAGKYWVANEKRIYSFDLDTASTGTKVALRGTQLGIGEAQAIASDNEIVFRSPLPAGKLCVESDNINRSDAFDQIDRTWTGTDSAEDHTTSRVDRGHDGTSDNVNRLKSDGPSFAYALASYNGDADRKIPGRQGSKSASDNDVEIPILSQQFVECGDRSDKVFRPGRCYGQPKANMAADNVTGDKRRTDCLASDFAIPAVFGQNTESSHGASYNISCLSTGEISGRYHLASDNLKPFDSKARKINAEAASDNEKHDHDCSANCVKNLTVYEFANNGEVLQSVYRAERAKWESGRIVFLGKVEKNDLTDGKVLTSLQTGGEIAESSNPFQNLRTKPNHLDSSELKSMIAGADSELDSRNLTVALEKKYTTLFLPFVMALFTAPFSLSLSRKGKAATVGYAIGLWLLFTGTSSIFEQLGLNGLLSPSISIWSPLVMFSPFGVYLLSKVRT